MIVRLPGFDVDIPRAGESRRREEQQRGFGQASENILINRKRVSSKAGGVADELSRIPAGNVLRIEILNGAALNIPGLSGQVANIVVESGSNLSGQFEWSPQYRPIGDHLSWKHGSVSLAGSMGQFDFSFGINSPNFGIVATGPTFIRAPDGLLLERHETDYVTLGTLPTITANAGFENSSGLSANLNLSLTQVDSFALEVDDRAVVFGPDRSRNRRFDQNGPSYEIGGDVEFALGPGRLKLIGVNSYKKELITETAVFSFVDGSPQTGSMFDVRRISREKIARTEYNWPMLNLDWQISGEAAFNTLDSVGKLAILDASGDFIPIPFPGGTGGVSEDRYETILSASGRLLPAVTFQVGAGAEFSTLSPRGIGSLDRNFTRPKGFISLGWDASDRLDLSFEIARRVGQLNFADFLATVSLAEDTENAANANLVPQQSWEAEFELQADLGRIGNATLSLSHHRIEDLVDFIALPNGSAARGNIAKATESGAELDATIELAYFGWNGARLDIGGKIERSRLTDPVDGRSRPISNALPHRFSIDLRHDIPGGDWAWGGGFITERRGQYFRVEEFGRSYTGPDNWSLFAENKDVAGLKVRAEVTGIFGPRRRRFRTLFDGVRGRDQIASTEDRNQNQGQIYSLKVSGSF